MNCKECSVSHICSEMGPDPLYPNCFVPDYSKQPESQKLPFHQKGNQECSFCDFPQDVCECGGVIHNQLNIKDGTLLEVCDNNACNRK